MSFHRFDENKYRLRAKPGPGVYGRVGKGGFYGKLVSGLEGEKVRVRVLAASRSAAHLKGQVIDAYFEGLVPSSPWSDSDLTEFFDRHEERMARTARIAEKDPGVWDRPGRLFKR